MCKRKNIAAVFVVFLLLIVLYGNAKSKPEEDTGSQCQTEKTAQEAFQYQENTEWFYRVWNAYCDAIEAAQELDCAFYLYDIESGWELGYDENRRFYSASTIKAPYIISVIEQDPTALEQSRTAIEAAIVVSDNESYRSLRRMYGDEVFEKWLQDIGCGDVEKEYNYANVTAKEMGIIWKAIYEFLETDSDDAKYCKELLANVSHSFLLEELGDAYTVYSKAGWIGGDTYQAENDAGIILYPGHPYVMAVMSTAYTRTDELGELAKALDGIHNLVVGESVADSLEAQVK